MYVKSGKLLKIRFLELVIASLHDIVVALVQSTKNPSFLEKHSRRGQGFHWFSNTEETDKLVNSSLVLKMREARDFVFT